MITSQHTYFADGSKLIRRLIREAALRRHLQTGLVPPRPSGNAQLLREEFFSPPPEKGQVRFAFLEYRWVCP